MRHSKPLDLDSLSHLAPELAAAIAAIASDIALVVDRDGIVQNVSLGRDAIDDGASQWVGKPWADTATAETRKKIQMLLDEASLTGVSQRREINHQLGSGAALPMMYAAVRLGENGPVLVAGRDLRAITAIQQRFLESQQEMERTYWTQRQAESRYRMLFQVATDAVLVVDAHTMRVIDANPSAMRVLDLQREELIGAGPFDKLAANSRRAAEEMLVTARATAKPIEIRVRISADHAPLTVSATPFRGDKEMLLLVRFSSIDETRRSSALDVQISGAVQNMSEAVVVADSGGRLLMANPAFLQLCGVAGETQIRGLSIGEWLGDSELDLTTLLAEVRQRGMTHAVPAYLKNLSGQTIAVEMFAALLTDGEQEHIGITLRRKSSDKPLLANALQQLTQTLETLVSKVGAMPMGDMLFEFKQAAAKQIALIALQQAQGSPTLAAAMLGLTTQELQDCLDSSGSVDHVMQPARRASLH